MILNFLDSDLTQINIFLDSYRVFSGTFSKMIHPIRPWEFSTWDDGQTHNYDPWQGVPSLFQKGLLSGPSLFWNRIVSTLWWTNIAIENGHL